MTRLIKISVVFVIVLFSIVIAGAALLHFTDLTPYHDTIEKMATKAIGRQIEINGQIKINLFPYPEVILNDVSLANAKWGTQPTMLSVGHVGAAIRFFSLFSDMIIVRHLRLKDVTVLLEKNDRQLGNWVINAPDAQQVDGKLKKSDSNNGSIVILPLMVDLIEFSNITVTTRTSGSTDQTYYIESVSSQPDNTGNIQLVSSGKLLGNPMALNGTITSMESVKTHGAVSLDIQASLGDSQLAGKLTTSRLKTLADLRGDIHITVKDIQKTLGKHGKKMPFTGPLTVDATINVKGNEYLAAIGVDVDGVTAMVDGSYSGTQLELNAKVLPLRRVGELFKITGVSPEPLMIKAKVDQLADDDFDIKELNVDIGDHHLAVKGRVNLENQSSDVALTFKSPNLSGLLATLPSIDLNAEATAEYSAEKMTLTELAATFDKSDLNGDFTLFRGEKPNIIANLTSSLLDLRPFSESNDAGENVAGVPTQAVTETSHEQEPVHRYVFKETPLQLKPIQSIEADAKIAVGHLFYDKIEFKNVVIDAAVHSGNANAKVKLTSLLEGNAAAKIDLKTQGDKVEIDTVVSLSGFSLGILSEGVSTAEVPLTSVSIELKTAGASPRELASGANGHVLLTQGSGKINNKMIEGISSGFLVQLHDTLNPYNKTETFSSYDCTILSFDIVDGLAEIDSLISQGEKVVIVGGGDIDLKTERLKIEFNTMPRTGFGFSTDKFVTPFIKLVGTLASPEIGLNKKGTLLAGSAAVATGGLSLLIQGALDRATAEGDHCAKTLEHVGAHIGYTF